MRAPKARPVRTRLQLAAHAVCRAVYGSNCACERQTGDKPSCNSMLFAAWAGILAADADLAETLYAAHHGRPGPRSVAQALRGMDDDSKVHGKPIL